MNSTQCSVDGCDRGVWSIGICRTHYRRSSVAERLAVGLAQMPNGCLEWTGGGRGGYGRIRVGRKSVMTHRIAWESANGPIPEGIQVLHHCDNPPCAQTEPTEGYPDGHLFLGTNDDNVADKVAKGRGANGDYAARTHCPEGHEYSAANTYVRPNGHRICRACHRAESTARYHNKKKREAAPFTQSPSASSMRLELAIQSLPKLRCGVVAA